MSRISVTVLMVLICVSHAAGADIEFNVTPICGWDGYYRPMEWTPIEIGVSSDATEPFGGTFTVSTRQDGLNTLNVTHPFVLTPELQHNIPLVTKIGFGSGQCDLSIRDDRGRLQWDSSIAMWDESGAIRLLYPIEAQDVLIGVVGQSRFGLLRLPQGARSLSDRGPGSVYLGSKTPAVVPRDWTGFTGLDVLVLYDPDWALMHRESLLAISQYVRNGGTLLLILGPHPLSRTNPLSELIPFAIDEPREERIDPHVLATWGLAGYGSDPVTAWPLIAKPTAQLTGEIVTSGGQRVYGQTRVGFGRVAVLGFDPEQFDNVPAEQTTPFWVALIRASLEDASDAKPAVSPPSDVPGEMLHQIRTVRPVAGSGRKGRTIVLSRDAMSLNNGLSGVYRISAAQSAGNRVMEFLYQLSQMRPLSIWWVVLILTTLALLLGPVDYFVLKRLDRLPLTWLTSLGWIAVFTVGAYYGVQYLRGGRMQLRTVSVVDGIAETDCTWATYYMGVFAPRNDNYRLEQLDARQWWSGIAPTEEQLGSYRRDMGTRQIHCVQADGANLPVSVPVSIWTVQTLMAETPAPSLPFSATVERKGQNVVAEVTNLSDNSIRSGFILLDDGWVAFGPVAPKSSRSVRGPRRKLSSRPAGLERYVSGSVMPQYPPAVQMTTAFLAPGCVDRSLAMQSYVKAGAALVCAEFDDAPAPFSIADRSYETVHIQLARQVVFPK